ncbi:hypothetical protein N9Z64_00900 [bacterium]|nr:hypothetical protein [bacterium]
MFTPQERLPVCSSLTGYGRFASIACLTLLLYSAPGSNLTALGQANAPERELPSMTLLGNEARALLRQEAVLKSGPEKHAAATALCDLYVVFRLDSRYSGSKMLQGDATRIRRRLISIAKRNEKQLKREGVARPPNLSSTVSSSIAAAITHYQSNNAQNNSHAAHGDASENATGSRDGNQPANSNDSQSSPDNDRPTGQNQAKGHAGAQAAGGVPDTGWELVELIQRIIAPDFWETRGGPGSIRYFAMRKVLVIRATTDVHEQVRDLLTALR